MTKKRKTPQQKLARLIQAATNDYYNECLRQATVILGSIGEDDELECGDRLQDWVCSLPPGPHPGWRHLDENEGYWWQQSGVFPYSNAVKVPARGPKADLVILDEATADVCPNCLGPVLAGAEHFACAPDPVISQRSEQVSDAARDLFRPPFLQDINEGGSA